MTDKLILLRPDDWHVHLRDGEMLTYTVRDVARVFNRAVVMPNLVPPIRNISDVISYRDRIMSCIPKGKKFNPLMTLYLTSSTNPSDIVLAKNSNIVIAAKLYPAGVTTNSQFGVRNIEDLFPVLEEMENVQMPLLIHGEVNNKEIDIFDRERMFIENILVSIIERFPRLKIVLEHITTSEAVDFVSQASGNIAATITAHHLLYNRNDMLAGGIRPHLYCLPILKSESHRISLLKAATGGNSKFFLGTDSAPHSKIFKENTCGCAGCYTACIAIELYAEIFDKFDSLDNLEKFSSLNGPAFYGIPANKEYITLIRKESYIPMSLEFGDKTIIPVGAGQKINWHLLEKNNE